MVVFSMLTLTNANGQQINSRKTEKMPSFIYHTLDGAKFTEKDLKENSRIMIVYFNPLCEVCQKETKEILGNMDYFSDIQIVMVSPNSETEINEFVNEHGLKKHSQIIVLHDYNDVFYKQFHAIGYPSLYLYDEEKQLIEHFDTQVSMAEIKTAFAGTSAQK
jgi:peroxiredoxin